MTEELNPTEQPLYDLSDVDVVTVGLVSRGASGKEFFLLKSGENSNKDSDAQSEQELTEKAESASSAETSDESSSSASVEESARSFWMKLLDLVRSVIRAETSGSSEEEEPEESESESVSAEKSSDTADDSESLSQTEEPTPPSSEPIQPLEAETSKSISAISEQTSEGPMPEDNIQETNEVEKSAVPAEPNAEMLAKLALLEKANQDLQARVEKAEQEAAAERDARELQTFVEKAATFINVPVTNESLGEQLHWLTKQAPERAAFWTDLVKSMDAALRDYNFIELGTAKVAKTGADIVEKAKDYQKTHPEVSFADAMLALGPQEAETYLRSRKANGR